MKKSKKPLLAVIAGPTASGKTSLCVNLALYFSTEIISADSRQIYKELCIGVARPSPDQMQAVRHHFIGTVSVQSYYNASMFETETLNLLSELFITHPIVIMTGGSGLYIDAVCKGIDDLPTIKEEVRNALLEEYRREGIKPLQEELRQADPKFFSRADIQNPKRILKALEVFRQTGKPYSSFLTGAAKQRPFRILKIALDIPRGELYNRIDNRVDEMLHLGLEKEARNLYPFRHLNALNTVGYKELFNYFEGKCSKEEAIRLIKRNTRRYARRQLTWFRNDPEYQWFSPSCPDAIIHCIEKAKNELL